MRTLIYLCLCFLLLTDNSIAVTKRAAYKGKMIDAVTQWPVIYSLKELSKKIKQAGISYAGISINSYKPKKEFVKRASKAIDGDKTFYKGSPKYFHFASSLTKKAVDHLISEIRNRKYVYISEVMYRHADKKLGLTTPAGERTIDPLSSESLYLMKQLSQNFPQIPVFIHWEFYEWKTDYEKFSRLFQLYPKQTFIVNHLGFGTPEQVDLLLKNNPNVYFTISKRNTKFEYFLNPKTFQGEPIADKSLTIQQDWKKLFIAHPKRFLFATDSHKDYMWDSYSKIVNEYREILGQLPIEVATDIAFKNALKIMNLKE